MNMNLYLMIGLLILPVIWFITDPRPFKERLSQYLNPGTLILLVIEVGLVYLNFRFSNTLSLNDSFLMVGVFLGILGLFIAIWAKITMGKVWGRPAQHNIKRQNKLIMDGPFQFSRNPIYLGLILAFLGYSLSLKSIFIILNLFLIVFFYYSALKEEKLLEKHFGKEYLKYKSSTPRLL